MTKRELEKAIENGKSVWVVFNQYSYENDSVKEIDFTKVECLEFHNDYFQYFNSKNLCGHYYKLTFKTKAEAEHYLHHANITRTETLPFLTWEEFLEGKEIKFNSKKSEYLMIYLAGNITIYKCYYDDNGLKLELRIFDEEATEANFYKAYDKAVRLFKEEE